MRIKVNRDNCTGCRLCLQVCAIDHFMEINPKKAALRIEAKFPEPGKFRPFVCTQCGKCAEVCPEDAVYRNEAGGYVVDKDMCTNCGDCVVACPVKVICQHPDLGYVIKCDFCMECTKVCNTSAIVEWERKPVAKGKEARNE